MIEIKNVSKNFGDIKALDNVSLEIEKGHIYGFFGRNGAGKSTLMRAIADYIPLTGGSISATEDEDLSRLVSLSSEDNLFLSSLRVKKILEYLSDIGRCDAEEEARLLRVFNLNGKKKWEKLSQGERMMLKNIITLSSDAEYLLFDEPVANLDPVNRDLFYHEVMRKLEEGKAVFISTHLINDIENVADRIIFIDSGRIILNESAEKLSTACRTYSKPDSTFIKHGFRLNKPYWLIFSEERDEDKEHVDLENLFIEMAKEDSNENYKI